MKFGFYMIPMFCITILISILPPMIVYNVSPSAPCGIYQIVKSDLKKGSYVRITDPWTKKILLKIITGIPGDKLSIDNEKAILNKTQFPRDAKFMAIIRKNGNITIPKNNTQIIPANKYFVAGQGKTSYDSRYFGLIEKINKQDILEYKLLYQGKCKN